MKHYAPRELETACERTNKQRYRYILTTEEGDQARDATTNGFTKDMLIWPESNGDNGWRQSSEWGYSHGSN